MAGWKRSDWFTARLLLAIAIALVAVMGSASAQVFPPGSGGDGLPQWEGQWTSFIYSANQGFNSRTWSNKVANTTRIEFEGCSIGGSAYDYGSFKSTDVQLTRRTGVFWPDQNKGRKRFECRGFDAKNWSLDPSADVGDYRFAITHINGCATCTLLLNVDKVTVKYGKLR